MSWPVSVGDVALAVSLVMLGIVTLYPTVVYWLSQKRPPCRVGHGRGSVGLVVAAYEEPVHLLERLLRNCTSFADKVIIVWDGRGASEAEEAARRLLGERVVFVSRPRGLGKANALNTALRHADTDYVVLLDIDDCTGGEGAQWASCDSVVGHWLPGRGRMLTEALGEAIAFASRILYVGRCRLGRPVFFLGSGSSVSRRTALELGGWSEDVVLEDVEFGLRLLAEGRSVCFGEDLVVEVGVPPSYSGFRTQQSRWAQGAVQLLTRRLGLVLRAGGPEAVLYLLQYVLVALWQPLLVLAVFTGASHTFSLLYTGTAILLLSLAGYTYTRFLRSERGHSLGKAVRLAAASTALSACLTPTLLVSMAEGVLGRRVWRRTPKTSGESRLSTLLPEVLYSILTLYATVHAATMGLPVYPLLLLHALAPIYVALRFHRQLG